MRLHDTNVVVSGGAGFIGSHVVDQLVTAGCHVTVIDDLSTGDRSNLERHDGSAAVQLHEADIRDRDAMMDLVRDAEAVLHLAVASLRVSLARPLLVHEINATGTLNVCQAAIHNGVRRVVYVSSSEAYGSAVYAPMDELHPLVPETVYGASKAAGELYALAHYRTYGLETSVIRPFNSYGPREHAEGTSAEVIPRFVYRGMAGLQPIVFGDGKQTRDFTWVEDTARGIILAAESDDLVGGTVNIARGAEVSLLQLIEHIGRLLDRDDFVPIFDDDRPGDVLRHYADVTKAERLLGYRAEVGIEEGLARYVAWLRDTEPDLEAWLQHEPVRNW